MFFNIPERWNEAKRKLASTWALEQNKVILFQNIHTRWKKLFSSVLPLFFFVENASENTVSMPLIQFSWNPLHLKWFSNLVFWFCSNRKQSVKQLHFLQQNRSLSHAALAGRGGGWPRPRQWRWVDLPPSILHHPDLASSLPQPPALCPQTDKSRNAQCVSFGGSKTAQLSAWSALLSRSLSQQEPS